MITSGVINIGEVVSGCVMVIEENEGDNGKLYEGK